MMIVIMGDVDNIVKEMMQPLPTHRYLDISKIKQDLGCRDVMHPADALAHTAFSEFGP